MSGFWPTQDNSITGVFVVQQVAALARLGVKVTVLLMKTIGRPASPFLTVDELNLPTDKVAVELSVTARLPERLSETLLSLRLNAWLSGLFYSRAIKKLVESGGPFAGCIVHGSRYANMSLPIWRGHAMGKVLGVLHGVDPLLARAIQRSGKRALYAGFAEGSDAIVLVGSPLRKHASVLGVPESKQVVVNNGTDLPSEGSFPHPSHEADSRTKVRIVSVSNLIELKGIDHNLIALADLASRRPDLEFEYVIVGDGPEKNKLINLSEELNLSGQVHFLGRLPYPDTMEEISKSDLFSLPSWGEAFGIVYLEAMARGKPVVGCFENGAEDIFEHGKHGFLINPKDIHGLSEYLEQLISGSHLRVSMGTAGQMRAQDFTWENNARKMMELLGFHDEVAGNEITREAQSNAEFT